MKSKRLSYPIALILFFTLLLMASGAVGQSVVTTISFNPPSLANNVGFGFEVAVAPNGSVYLGASGAYDSEVGVINPITHSLTTVIPLPTNGALNYEKVNRATSLIYFRQPNSNIVVIDARPSSPTFNQALPTLTLTGRIVQSFDVDETRGLLYVTNTPISPAPSPIQAFVTVFDINPASATFHQIVQTVSLPAGAFPRGIAVNETANKVYFGATAGPTLGGLYALDGATLSFAKIPGTFNAFGVAVNETANLVYAIAQGDQMIAADGATNTMLAMIPIPGLVPQAAPDEKLAIHSGTGRVYLQTSEVLTPGKLIVIDGDRFSPTFNTVLASIPVGRASGAGDVVVDESLNRIATTSFFDKRTSIIDGATNTVIAAIPSTQIPSDVAFDPLTHRAYVANQGNFLQEINLSSATLAANIITGAEAGRGVVNPNDHCYYVGRTLVVGDLQVFDQHGASQTVSGLPHASARYLFTAVNRHTNRIYALNSLSNLAGDTVSIPGYVSVIDGNSRAVIANVEVGNQPFGLGINQATNKIYVTNNGFGAEYPGSITVIDGVVHGATNADTSAFPITASFNGDVAVNETTNRIYFRVAGAPSSSGVLDGATNVAMPLPATFNPVANIRVNQSLNRVYLITGTGLLHVLDGTSHALITTLSVGSLNPTILFPIQVAVNESTGQVIVADFNNDTVTIIDGLTNTLLATLAVGDGPSAVAVNELSNRIYVGNLNDNTISFIDGGSLTVTATLPMPLRPAILSVDASVSRIFVSTMGAPDQSGVFIVADVEGTFEALRQAILVATSDAPPGIRNSLINKAEQAQEDFEQGKIQKAISKLNALQHQVSAQRGKHLTQAEADQLLGLIATLIASLS